MYENRRQKDHKNIFEFVNCLNHINLINYQLLILNLLRVNQYYQFYFSRIDSNVMILVLQFDYILILNFLKDLGQYLM